jgi:hypothetical protein
MPFRDLVIDHPVLTHDRAQARRAFHRFYKATGRREWTVAYAALLATVVELKHCRALERCAASLERGRIPRAPRPAGHGQVNAGGQKLS